MAAGASKSGAAKARQRSKSGIFGALRRRPTPSDFDSLLSDDYYEIYSEAHRRRPTFYEFPSASLHVSVYYPGKFPEVQPFLLYILQHFSDWTTLEGPDFGDKLDAEAASRHIYEFYSREDNDPRQQRVLFDFKCQRKDKTTWRVICQREYVAITLQTQFSIEESQGGKTIVRSSFFGEGYGPTAREAGSAPADDGMPTMTSLLYDDLQKGMRRALDEVLVEAINKWAASPKAARGYERRWPQIFGNFYGCAVPWQAYSEVLAAHRAPDEDAKVNQPLFPKAAAGGFTADTAKSDAMAPTERFLADIWLTIAPHVMDGNYNDCVACYLEQGHSIYITNLGSQRDNAGRSPLKYVLLFDQEAFDRPDAAGAPAATRGALTRSAAWRLSRLVNRLHDIGTVRLAALRYMGVMLKYDQRLRHIEFDLQHHRNEFENLGKLRVLEDRLIKYGQGIPDLIMDRAARTERYYRELVTLSEDLGTVPIPTWQSYEQFIRRRLFSTLETVTSLGTKYQEVRDTIANINNSHIATKVFSLQSTAELFAGILLFYYIPHILEDIYKHTPAISLDISLAKIRFNPKNYLSENGVYLIGFLLVPVVYFNRHIRSLLRKQIRRIWNRLGPTPAHLPKKATTEKFHRHLP